MDTIITKIRKELKANSDKKIQEGSFRFFKETIKCYGVKTAIVKKIGREYFKTIKNKSKTEIFDLCDELWRSGFIEESFIACSWSYYIHKDYKPADFKIFKKWLNEYVNNWASCDSLCNHTIGTFIEMYPEYLSELKKTAKSKNRWVRRGAAVSLIVPAGKGKFLTDILEIADLLFLDKDDLVQKGYGWMLKAASQIHQQKIFDYVINRKADMPRTALRYAIEKMPKELKAAAMKK